MRAAKFDYKRWGCPVCGSELSKIVYSRTDEKDPFASESSSGTVYLLCHSCGFEVRPWEMCEACKNQRLRRLTEGRGLARYSRECILEECIPCWRNPYWILCEVLWEIGFPKNPKVLEFDDREYQEHREFIKRLNYPRYVCECCGAGIRLPEPTSICPMCGHGGWKGGKWWK